jgi:ketosteroid isomerase-like protein
VPANEQWQALGDDVALRTAEVRIDQEFPDGRRATTPSHLSVVFRREGEGWRIVQMHSSAQTAPPAAPR